ncbi:MAG: alpha/beta hydrolase [Candidatus Nanohalobium sp.]
MEKVKFENGRGLELVGNFWRSDSDKGVVMAHGFTGNKEEWGRFTQIAENLNDSGFNVLAFDFSGCGESDDDSITVEKEIEDLDAAIRFIDSREVSEIGVLGLSQGGLVSLRRADEDIEALVLMAPVTDSLGKYRQEKLSEQQRKELRENGWTVRTRERGVRDRYVIPEKVIDEKENLDQDELLNGVETPVLFVHGSNDGTVPIEQSRGAVEKLDDAELVEVDDDHYFDESVEKVSEVSVEWFREKMKEK